MTILQTFMGITLLTTSLTGEATGKIGRYGSTAIQYVCCGGKEATGFVGDVSQKASERISNWGNNDFIKVTSNLSQATSNLAYCASGLLEAGETGFKNISKLFGKLDTGSQWLRGRSTNLIRDEEYRDLNVKFNFKTEPGTCELEGEEDWDEVKPIIKDDNKAKKITLNQTVSSKWTNQAKNCLPLKLIS